MIRVLVVEDSPVVKEFINHVLSSDSELKVVGNAGNGEEALQAVKRFKPDVITMDIHMPKMDGFEATRRIMETQPTPIVVVSGSSTAKEIAFTFRAIEAGALAVVNRPRGIGHPEFESSANELVQIVKAMSEVKVVRRWPPKGSAPVPPVVSGKQEGTVRIVAIGSSTGGPLTLKTILSGLPKNFPIPLLIVQHMSPGFIEGFIEWLEGAAGFPVRKAVDGEYARPGTAYVAPDGMQMGIDAQLRISLSQESAENGVKPSVSHLFRSVAQIYGKNAIGVILTGMGKDGAEELKLMRSKGAVTMAQDEESSVVYGMPGEAVKMGAATYILPPEKIAQALVNIVVR